MNLSDANNDLGQDNIETLIETLKSKDGIARQNARNALVRIGEPALDALIKAFEIKKEPVHWEVAKALSQIGTPKAADVLVNALEDKEFSIRWIAAEGLIHIGSNGLISLLEALKNRSRSVWLREGCHHVFHDLVNRKIVNEEERKCLSPVIEALNHLDSEMESGMAARRAIEGLHKKVSC